MTQDNPGELAGVADETPSLSHRQIMEVLAGLLLAMFVAALSATVVATALPTIVGELGGQDKLSWVISATLLTVTASTPLWGKMSDLYGRKPLFLLAMIIFVAASALAGLSQNIEQLIAARALQGVGAGGLQALSQAILADVVAPRERGRYVGYIGGVFGLATLAGPLIGGFLVDAGDSGWRWTFYAVIPLGVLAFAVVQRTLRIPLRRRKARVDYWGAATITGGITALLLLVSFGGKEFGWTSGWAVALAAVALALLLSAVAVERRASEPILPPRLFRDRTFVLASVAGFFTGMAMFGGIAYLPQYLQIVQGESPTASGLLTLPMMMGLFGGSMSSGRIITRLGRWKIFPVIGLLLVALGMFLLSMLDPSTSLVVATTFMAVLGLGVGLTMQVLVLAVQNTVSRDDIGIATSAASFFRSMGGAVGVAMFGAILTNRLSHRLPELIAERGVTPPPGEDLATRLGSPQELESLPDPLLDVVRLGFSEALTSAFLVGAPLAVLGWLAVIFLRDRAGRCRGGAP